MIEAKSEEEARKQLTEFGVQNDDVEMIDDWDAGWQVQTIFEEEVEEDEVL